MVTHPTHGSFTHHITRGIQVKHLLWAWNALLLVLTVLLLPVTAVAQDQEVERYHEIEDLHQTVPCLDRQCRVFRLGLSMESRHVGHLFLQAQRLVERSLGRAIVNDANADGYTIDDMLRPFAPRERRNARGEVTRTLPPILADESRNGTEYVTLEMLFSANTGNGDGSYAPFQVVARNGRRHYTGIYFGNLQSARRRGLPEAVTLGNVGTILSRLGVSWVGRVSISDNLRVRIPTTGGPTVGQRIDALITTGRAAMADGITPEAQMTIARLNRDRATFRELRARPGVFIETARRDAFDVYVDEALTYIERHPQTATPAVTPVQPSPAAPTMACGTPANPCIRTVTTRVTVPASVNWRFLLIACGAMLLGGLFLGRAWRRQAVPAEWPLPRITDDESDDASPPPTSRTALPDDKTERIVTKEDMDPAAWAREREELQTLVRTAEQKARDAELRWKTTEERRAIAETRAVELERRAQVAEAKLEKKDAEARNFSILMEEKAQEVARVKQESEGAINRAAADAAHARDEAQQAKDALAKQKLEEYARSTALQNTQSRVTRLEHEHAALKAAFKQDLLATDELLRALLNEQTLDNAFVLEQAREGRRFVGGMLERMGIDLVSIPPAKQFSVPPKPPSGAPQTADDEPTQVRTSPYRQTLPPPGLTNPPKETASSGNGKKGLGASLGDRAKAKNDGKKKSPRNTLPHFAGPEPEKPGVAPTPTREKIPGPPAMPSFGDASGSGHDPTEDTQPFSAVSRPTDGNGIK